MYQESMHSSHIAAHSLQAEWRSASILLAGLESSHADELTEFLAAEGLDVITASRSDHALSQVRLRSPQVIVSDLRMSPMDGLEFCRRLREQQDQTPFIMLGTREGEFDHVLALELGADDYLGKPVAPRVLLAHLKAVLRRPCAPASVNQPGSVELGRLRIDRGQRQVWVGTDRVDLAGGEFDVLWLLALNVGRVVTRAELLQKLRGLEQSHADRSMDARLYRLRRRFERFGPVADWIRSIRPHGYMLSTEPW